MNVESGMLTMRGVVFQRGVGSGDKQPEGSAVGRLLDKRPDALGVPDRVNPALIFHLDRQPSVPDDKDKVDLRIRSAPRHMR